MNKALCMLSNLRTMLSGYVDSEIKRSEVIFLDEIKAELEEAMKPKSCDGCKFVDARRFQYVCDSCSRWHVIEDRYEPKESV